MSEGLYSAMRDSSFLLYVTKLFRGQTCAFSWTLVGHHILLSDFESKETLIINPKGLCHSRAISAISSHLYH